MELSVIEMERPAAIKAFEEYRQAVRGRHFAEDEQLMRGYRELARGRRLVSLAQAVRDSGLMEADVGGTGTLVRAPRLAICEATAERCVLEVQFDGGGVFSADWPRRWRIRSAGLVGQGWVRMPADTFPRDRYQALETVVPLVPPALRPARGLGGYHVLWEVESWARYKRPTSRMPGDPALLKHIGGDLWAVVATWDLTELEKLVLVGRSRQPA